jgi:integrase
MKIDPYNHKEKYLKWEEKVKKEGIAGLSEKNSDIIQEYISDMANGINTAVSSKKGARGYPRLNNLRQRIIFIAREFENRFNIYYLGNLDVRIVSKYFTGLRNGTITRKDGEPYQAPGDYVKVLKAFWHWYMKSRQEEKIEDITVYLDSSSTKPKWVYLDESQIKKMCEYASYDYRVLIMFLLDTGMRSPSELINIKVSDVNFEKKELNIRDEISKTFGRRIKLMLSSGMLKEFIDTKNLTGEDYLFKISPPVTNRYLKRLGEKVFGKEKSLAGKKYSQLTMYDFRHCSCCYWLVRYKSESALKYRFGWKKSDKIHYYSELLGMKDTITEEDLLVDITKTEIEKRLVKSETENELLNERIVLLEKQMDKISNLTNQIHSKMRSK